MTEKSEKCLQDEDQEKPLRLQREINLLGGISIITGSMIGSGIFISPVGVLEYVGSIGASLIVWLLCGIVATFGSLTYAELGTMIPQSGAEYPYLNEAFGPVPAFLFAWTSSIVLKPSSVAILGIVFGEYVMRPFFPNCDEVPVIGKKLSCAAVVALITFLNCYSVRIAAKTQIIFTVAKLVVLLIICGTGFYALAMGVTDNLQLAFSKPVTWPTVGTAFYQGFWAYDGWNQLNYITEELQNPYVNLPRAIMIGIPLVTIVYIFVNIAYLSGLSLFEMFSFKAVAVTFGNKFLGTFAWIIPLGVALSTFGSINGYSITGPRITYAASIKGDMPKIFGMLHCQYRTPAAAIVMQNLIALVVLIPNDFDSLVNYFSFSMWMFHGGSALALIVLRIRQPDRFRPYKVPIVIPVLLVIMAIYLVFFPIIMQPTIEYLYATMFILSGLIFYFIFVRRRVRLAAVDCVTKYLQIVFNVAPANSE